MRRVVVLVAAVAALLGAAVPATADAARAKYDVRLLAKVPPPGYPALSLVAPDRTIYVGTFKNGDDSPNGPSKVFAYTPAGKLKRTYVIRGQDPKGNNGVQVAAVDAKGILYLLDQNPARVLKLNPRTGAQSTYATFHDVPQCPLPSGVGNECSATVLDNPPYPNYAAWGTRGELYVTDFAQALVWRIRPGGGVGHVWFTDEQLDGLEFGPAGIVLMPDRRTLMLDTLAGGPTSPNPTTGKLFTLGIDRDGTPTQLRKLYESGPREAPDGFALAKSGNIYIALVGPLVNQLVVVSPKGREIARISHAGGGGGDVPFDSPSSAVFDGKRLIVTNDAFFSGEEDHFALFDVYAGEPGQPIYVPFRKKGRRPGATRKPRYGATVRPRSVRAKRRVTLRVRVFRRGRPARPVRGARVRAKGIRARTNRRGRARLRVTFHRPGRRTLRVSLRGKRIAVARVRVRR